MCFKVWFRSHTHLRGLHEWQCDEYKRVLYEAYKCGYKDRVQEEKIRSESLDALFEDTMTFGTGVIKVDADGTENYVPLKDFYSTDSAETEPMTFAGMTVRINHGMPSDEAQIVDGSTMKVLGVIKLDDGADSAENDNE